MCLHLEGEFLLSGNPKSKFSGPIKKGLRLVLWGNSEYKATSCSFVKDVNIAIGEKALVQLVILSSKSIDKEIELGENYSVGLPGIKLGSFQITEILGEWTDKVP